MPGLLHDPERRYRRRQSRALLKLLFWVAVLAAVAVFAYQIGVEEIRGRESGLSDRLAQVQADLDAARLAADQALAAESAAEEAARQWEARYNRDVPAGPLSDLTELARRAIDEGVPADRLMFLIRTAGAPIDCQPMASRRFILPTPLYNGANTSVGFAGGRIIVSGFGQNPVTEDGSIDAAFDPSQPVVIEFTQIDGTVSSVEGPLPLLHALRLGEDEYRFAVREDEPSFVSIAGERCPLPQQTDPAPAR